MPFVTRDNIKKGKQNQKVVKVNTTAWGKDTFIYVRMLRASEIAEVEKLAKDTTGKLSSAESLVRWCIMGACNAKGNKFFHDNDKDFLLDQPLVPLRDIFTALINLNGIETGGDGAAKN